MGSPFLARFDLYAAKRQACEGEYLDDHIGFLVIGPWNRRQQAYVQNRTCRIFITLKLSQELQTTIFNGSLVKQLFFNGKDLESSTWKKHFHLWMFQVPEDPIISNSSDTVLIILNLSFGWKNSEISESDRAFCRARWLHHPSEKGTRLSSKCPVENTIKKCHKPPTRVIHIHLTLCTCSRKKCTLSPYPQPLKPQLCSLFIRCFGTMSMRSMSKWKRFLGRSCGDCHETGSKYPVCLAY